MPLHILGEWGLWKYLPFMQNPTYPTHHLTCRGHSAVVIQSTTVETFNLVREGKNCFRVKKPSAKQLSHYVFTYCTVQNLLLHWLESLDNLTKKNQPTADRCETWSRGQNTGLSTQGCWIADAALFLGHPPANPYSLFISSSISSTPQHQSTANHHPNSQANMSST